MQARRLRQGAVWEGILAGILHCVKHRTGGLHACRLWLGAPHLAPCPTPLMTSGARYSSVPTKLFARASGTATSVTGEGPAVA